MTPRDILDVASELCTGLREAEWRELLEAVPAMPTLLAQISAVIQVYERDVLKQVTWRP
jgi:hypothetical protein